MQGDIAIRAQPEYYKCRPSRRPTCFQMAQVLLPTTEITLLQSKKYFQLFGVMDKDASYALGCYRSLHPWMPAPTVYAKCNTTCRLRTSRVYCAVSMMHPCCCIM